MVPQPDAVPPHLLNILSEALNSSPFQPSHQHSAVLLFGAVFDNLFLPLEDAFFCQHVAVRKGWDPKQRQKSGLFSVNQESLNNKP